MTASEKLSLQKTACKIRKGIIEVSSKEDPYDIFICYKETDENGKNSFMLFVEGLLSCFDNSIHGGISCSFLMDTSATPLGITNETISRNTDIASYKQTGSFCAGEQKEFSTYLSETNEKYRSCPKKYIFVWTPDDSLSGNALAAAYVYSYYTLLSDSTISSFAIDLSGASSTDALMDLSYLMKYIDTADSLEVTKNLAALLGRGSWSEIVSASVIATYGVRKVYDLPAELNSGKSYRGEFAYFDFSTSNLIERWYTGLDCKSLKIDYKAEGEKSLRADLLLKDTKSYSELLYIYEYPENMIYTPYVRVRFHISDAAEDSLYEVKLSFAYSGGRAESSVIVSGDEVSEVAVNLSQYVISHSTESLRISVRSLDGAAAECSLWIYDIYGCSEDYTSDRLADLISLERDKIRSIDEEAEDLELFGSIALALGIVIVTGAIGFGLFASFRREDNGNSDDNSNDE